MQLYLNTLGVSVEPEMKPPVHVEQTVNEQRNHSPNLVGLVIFLVGIVVLAVWGFGIVGEGSESNISPIYSLVFIIIVGGPILIVLTVFSLMLTYVTNSNKKMPNVQTASIQGLSTEENWHLIVEARRKAKQSSTEWNWSYRIFSTFFIAIGIWILGAVSSLGGFIKSFAATSGVIFILVGVLLFRSTLRTITEEIESE